MTNIMDKLIEKIKQTQNPTVMGFDTRYEMIPDFIKNKYPKTLDGAKCAIIEFNKSLIDSVFDIIPAIKVQIAFYEMYAIPGMEAFKETCRYAKEKGLIVIADIKRGDIGSTAQGYSSAYLGKTKIGDFEESVYDIDFITVNPYMGTDCVKPFLEDCQKYDKGLFILVKTSNPSSGDLQDLKLENGIEVYKKVANLVKDWGKDFIGENGYSSISAVVGATYPKQLEELRKFAPHTFFLVPGYGAQGGKSSDIALAFDNNNLGGIINASRSLMCAYKSDLWKDKFSEFEFSKATRAEVLRMKDDINNAIVNKRP